MANATAFYDEKECENCEYSESCKMISVEPNPDNAKRIRHTVDINKTTGYIQAQKKSTYTKGHISRAGENNRDGSLSEILLYILSLDDNTVSLLKEIIANPNITQTEIARKRGVSRQRINTALLHACRKNPQLEKSFQPDLK